MPSYAYRAIHASGRVSRGEMAAANENELAHYLSESGFELIHAKEQQPRGFAPSFLRNKVPPRVISAFCARMHDLLQSGILFAEALRDVSVTTDNKIMAAALSQVAQKISNGAGIAAAFSLYRSIFPPVFIAIVAAGEKSGDMSEIFHFLACYTDNRAQTQERLRRSLRYPLFLLLVAGSAIAFMLTMVVPQIIQFLNGIDGHLPLATRVLVALAAAFTDHWFYTSVGLVTLTLGLFIGRAYFPGFHLAIDRALLRMPVVGGVITKTSLARFTQSFSILFRSGCDVPSCLAQAGETVNNRALRQGIAEAEQRVVAGAALSSALAPIMPSFAIGMLRTGERSGNLGKSLDDITLAYDREAQAAADHMIGLLEPGLTLLIGAFLAWTVVAVLSPLYGSLSVLGARM